MIFRGRSFMYSENSIEPLDVVSGVIGRIHTISLQHP